MENNYSVEFAKVIQDIGVESVYLPTSEKDIIISSSDVNRPGLQLVGFYEYFDNKRIQVFGNAEYAYLRSLSDEQRSNILDAFFEKHPPVVIITRGLDVFDEMIKAAHKYNVPIMRTHDSTSNFMTGILSRLTVELAPRITRHGVLVEVYGEGVLMLGESGVGKSETAIELVKRGHRLIADDAVELRRVSNRTLVGTSPENIRHFVELRGIGIINARRLFGMGSVKVTEKVDMVVQLELWDQNKIYDRMGMDNEYTSILGINVPSYTIPVKPGRNLAIIIEVAAMNNRQKQMGYNATQELLQKLGMMSVEAETTVQWDAF